MKRSILSIIFLLSSTQLFAQESITSYRLDEGHLNFFPGYSIVADPHAHNANAVKMPASAPAGTFWFGPYGNFQAGNYLVHFRLKVASNSSANELIEIDASSPTHGRIGILAIRPDMFRQANQWQTFSFEINVPENLDNLELRGINFNSGVTDLFLDYISLIPGELKGFFSNEFTITGKGNVGIGTINPNAKLAVNGNIRAKEVKVENSNWPDFVFAKSYQLPTLNATEKYIKANGHLQGIPSASEVKTNGINLGELNAKLLEKIEELTLYLIEKDKSDHMLRREIKDLKAEVKSLKANK